MIIGIDFDNTVICYDEVFYQEALKRGWIPSHFPRDKKRIRQHLWQTRDDRSWQVLQALAYGQKIGDAVLIGGVKDFLDRCRKKNARVTIVSHKTEYAAEDPTQTNLREAALRWIRGQGLRGQDVFFEATRLEKIERMNQLDCAYFIDDLEEIFTDPRLAKSIGKILYAPHGDSQLPGVKICKSWGDIASHIFGNEKPAP